MSRWVENYNSHPFKIAWDDLKTKFDEINIKNIQDNNMLIEISRAKKLIKYIDSYFNIIDPELNITNVQSYLNNLNTQNSNIINNIQHYLNTSQTNIGYLHNINNGLDAYITQLKNLNITIPKVSAPAIHHMLKAYSNTIKESLEEIDLNNTIKASKQIKELQSKLFDSTNEHLSIEASIEKILHDFEKKHIDLKEFYENTLTNPDEEKETIKDQIENSFKKINKYSEESEISYIKFKKQLNDFKEYYYVVFGSEDEDNKTTGLKKELDTLLKSFKSFEQEQEEYINQYFSNKINEFEKFEEEIKQLTQKLHDDIRSYLPGAQNAGLSEAYKIQKEEYEKPIKLWNLAFISTVIIMFLGTFFMMFESINITTLEFIPIKVQNIEETIKLLLQKLPFYAPLIWIAIYSNKRRSENQRLKQEYAHKQALASSYGSYKKQIEELQEEDQKMLIKLINASIDTVSENASKSLDKKHGDSIPSHEILTELLNKIKITKKPE